MLFLFIFLTIAVLMVNQKKLSLLAFYLSFAMGIFWFLYHAADKLNLSF